MIYDVMAIVQNAPATGDTFPKAVLIGVIAVAVIGVVGSAVLKKKKK